ncbi:hypothetical protein HBI56_016880 [Parastagonospora nodorum]|uniref:Uncharacterized protein n=1 Tax=Phaeosphaeria nodorum (strain SN15 / ATCC MYA-4574 / FGSC 10173) TaxID=321614 RepID=A0A7U2F508_PHANO|nr:hypothetical protein HBH56_083120 [Parastagonospora nodorum]QRC96710.1 hypothetical protein JI435_409490 [Parastagonospora nodorum SN15]KAH3929832.1 hypothetical protein HBH54_118710 [Parastagonospora nodorum]KAH3955707.1 hypothetical protein HBH53_005850 [Parastagonospora nodorum]KAH3976951.1 hypothetical protein HBH51_075660 [Parastagonospora nodorum]
MSNPVACPGFGRPSSHVQTPDAHNLKRSSPGPPPVVGLLANLRGHDAASVSHL